MFEDDCKQLSVPLGAHPQYSAATAEKNGCGASATERRMTDNSNIKPTLCLVKI